jgi:hypothetical protein
MTRIWRMALRSSRTGEGAQRILIGVCLFAIVLLALPGAAAAAAGTGQSGSACPSASSLEGHVSEDPALQVSYTISGNVATYSITTTNENPSEGVPGLIAYCVYTSPLPESTEASYSNSYGAWTSAVGSGSFGFRRSRGNRDNLPFDGTTQVLGSATWSEAVPTTQLILLHINDEALCTALEGKKTETCFVRPRLCHMLKGVGHFGPRGPGGINLNNNMSTCPQNSAQRKGRQVFEMTWENHAQHMHMSRLTSAGYSTNGGEQAFNGTGEATVNHMPGYEIEFTFTLTEGRSYLWVLIKKADELVQEFDLVPLNKGTKQHIS